MNHIKSPAGISKGGFITGNTGFAIGILFFFLISPSLFALDLQVSGSLGNLAFDTEKESALSLGDTPFKETFFYKAFIGAEEAISDAFTFGAALERDPILRNTALTRIGFDAGFTKIIVGPFFGVFNNRDSILTPGLSTTIRLELPGYVFGSFRADSTIGAGLSAPGAYVQERSEISLGFYVPNVITTLRIASEAFTERKEADLTVKDERTRYELLADIYKKNIPYTAHIALGYQDLKRSYITQSSTTTDELGSFMLGMDVSARVSANLKVSLGGELPLYAWGIGKLKSPAADTVLYQINVGFTWTFLKKTQDDYIPEEEEVVSEDL